MKTSKPIKGKLLLATTFSLILFNSLNFPQSFTTRKLSFDLVASAKSTGGRSSGGSFKKKNSSSTKKKSSSSNSSSSDNYRPRDTIIINKTSPRRHYISTYTSANTSTGVIHAFFFFTVNRINLVYSSW
jgi:hypothetical protein